LATVTTFLWLHGGLPELYSQVIVYNLRYVTSYADSILSQELLAQAWHSAIWTGFVWLPAVIGLVWGKVRHGHCLLLCWFLADLVGAVAVGGKHLPHYLLQVVPSLAVLAGSGWAHGIERGWFSARRIRIVALIVFISASLTMFLYGQVYISRHWVQYRLGGNTTAVEQAARYLAANSERGETAYVWGAETSIYLLSGHKSASRYAYLYPVLAIGYTGPEIVEELLSDLKEAQPRYVIDASASNDQVPPLSLGVVHHHENPMYTQDLLAPVRQYILDNYSFETQIDQWKIYQLTEPDAQRDGGMILQ
jgi:4-amino-4-deoxy-L-arabinose transferase-like glycosyltransferase